MADGNKLRDRSTGLESGFLAADGIRAPSRQAYESLCPIRHSTWPHLFELDIADGDSVLCVSANFHAKLGTDSYTLMPPRVIGFVVWPSARVMYKKPLLSAVVSWALTGCATPVQLVYDAEVDRLCADAGSRVFEHVELPASSFSKSGYFLGFDVRKGELALGPDYRYVSKDTYIKGSSVSGTSLQHFSAKVYRVSDGKLLGTSDIYFRRGGDLPIGLHPSVHSCPEDSDFIKAIFTTQNKK